MDNFERQLRQLVEDWRQKGASDESIIEALRDEIESLNDLRSSRDR